MITQVQCRVSTTPLALANISLTVPARLPEITARSLAVAGVVSFRQYSLGKPRQGGNRAFRSCLSFYLVFVVLRRSASGPCMVIRWGTTPLFPYHASLLKDV